MPVYGGDEVSAIVLDAGTHTTRVGYAGEDSPKHVFPTSYSLVPPSSSSSTPSYHLGDLGAPVYRPYSSIHSPLSFDSVPLADSDSSISRLLTHSFKNQMRLETLDEHPLMVTEPGWTTKEARENWCEMAFEEWGVPAYYSADRAVLSAFSAGKGTALVLDIGEGCSSAVPVFDGFVIKKGIRKQQLSGSTLTSLVPYILPHLQSSTPSSSPSPITPHYLIKSRTPVPPNTPPQVVLREDRKRSAPTSTTATDSVNGTGMDVDGGAGSQGEKTTESFDRYHVSKVFEDYKETVGAVLPEGWNDAAAAARGPRAYEFPDGFNSVYGRERFMIGEMLFNPMQFMPTDFRTLSLPPTTSAATTPPTLPISASVPMDRLLLDSLNACDVDLQATLMANVVVVGGTTLMPGFVERLEWQSRGWGGHHKIKIHASGSTLERKYSSWLGGSILASLGAFHQLWIGKEEYQENGKTVLHRRAR